MQLDKEMIDRIKSWSKSDEKICSTRSY